MRLTKLRLLTLGIGLLAAALTAAGLVVPSGTAKASTTTNFLVTLYGWPDNSPPGNAIAYPADQGYPTIHNVASGTGTYSDPVTFATDQAELPVGSIVYYPYLHRYFIMEDDCTACDQDWTGQGPDGGPGFHHIDLWANGQNGNSTDAINCEDALTRSSAPVIISPPSNEPVDTTPLFNSSTNACYNPSSFTGGGGPEGPYGGTAAAVPGTVQAENYDTGGQGTAYNVTSVNGSDNAYRSDGVDLETTTDTGGGNDLGWTTGGQWFKYTVNVATAGTHTIALRLASPNAVTDGLHIANSAGTNLSGNVNVPATGGYQTWTTVNATVTLPAGVQTLTVDQDNAGWNINYLTFS